MKKNIHVLSRILAVCGLSLLLLLLASCEMWDQMWTRSEATLSESEQELLYGDTDLETVTETEAAPDTQTETEVEIETEIETVVGTEPVTEAETETEIESETETVTETVTETEIETETESETETKFRTDLTYDFDADTYHEGVNIHYRASEESPNAGLCVVIDAGHQLPGSSNTVAVGATGTTTGQLEYELNLQVALRLRNELVSRGYSVVMIRETNNVNISNTDRAILANSYTAVYDEMILVSIHADSFTSENAVGAHVIYTTENNANALGNVKYAESKALAQAVRTAYLTNCSGIGQNRSNKERNDLAVINASEVPAILLEMGFLSNPGEDTLMATDEFRLNAAVGIANGIDAYFAN